MKKQTIITLLLLTISSVAFSQIPGLDWAKTIGGTGSYTYSKSIVIDGNDHIITVGEFTNTVDLDPGAGQSNATSNGSRDIYIQKTDANGNLIWAKHFGGTQLDRVAGVSVDGNNNIYISGSFAGTVDFDPNAGIVNRTAHPTNINQRTIYVLKLTSTGNFSWVNTTIGPITPTIYDAVADHYGNVYVCGSFTGSSTFGQSGNTVNFNILGNDGFIQKIDLNGNFEWVNTIAGAGNSKAISLALDPYSNGLYCTGSFTGSPVIGSSYLPSNGDHDIFIAKWTLGGTNTWAKQIGGSEYGEPRGITVDYAGNVITTGTFIGTFDFNPSQVVSNNLTSHSNVGSGTGYSMDAFIQKMDANGNYLWAQRLGDHGAEVGLSIVTDSDNNIYSTGTFQHTVDFHGSPGQTSNLTAFSGMVHYVHKINSGGWFQSVMAIEGGSFVGFYGHTLACNSTCEVYKTHYINGVATNGPLGQAGTQVQGFTDAYTANITYAYTMNTLFDYRVYCDNSGNAKIEVTGGVQPSGANPKSDWYLFEYDPNHIWDPNYETLKASITWGQQSVPYNYNTLPLEFNFNLEPGKLYFIKHGMYDDCSPWQETREYGITIQDADPDPEFHLSNIQGSITPKQNFTTTDNIYLIETNEANNGYNYRAYYIDLWRRPCNSGQPYSWVANGNPSNNGWTAALLPGSLDLKATFGSQQFWNGYEYKVKLALSNYCNGWVAQEYEFAIDPCTIELVENPDPEDRLADLSLHEISVFPNPTTGIINIQTEDVAIQSIDIIDALGRIIKSYNNQLQLDLSFLEAGMYIMRCNSNQGVINKQFIKQ